MQKLTRFFILQDLLKRPDNIWDVVNAEPESRDITPRPLKAHQSLSPQQDRLKRPAGLAATAYVAAEATLDASKYPVKLVKLERSLTHLKHRYAYYVLGNDRLDISAEEFAKDLDIRHIVALAMLVCPRKLLLHEVHQFIEDNAVALPNLWRLNGCGALVAFTQKGKRGYDALPRSVCRLRAVSGLPSMKSSYFTQPHLACSF